MPLILREPKGSKITIKELDSNLLGLKNLTFVGEDFSKIEGDFTFEAGFYGETITTSGPDLTGLTNALDSGSASLFYQPLILNDVDINYFGTKVYGTASSEGSNIDLLSLNGFVTFKGYEGSFGNGGYTNVSFYDGEELTQIFISINTSVVSYFYGYGKNLPFYNHVLMIQNPIGGDVMTHYQIDVNSETEEITLTVKTLMEQV